MYSKILLHKNILSYLFNFGSIHNSTALYRILNSTFPAHCLRCLSSMSSICTPCTEFWLRSSDPHFIHNPFSVVGDSAINSIMILLKIGLNGLTKMMSPYLCTTFSPADISNQNVLAIALKGKRTTTVSTTRIFPKHSTSTDLTFIPFTHEQ